MPQAPRSVSSPGASTQPGSGHYENFPVASWLCPAHLRAPIAAIYWFARTADDMADEGSASAAERLADLAAYRADLAAVYACQATSARWAALFTALQRQMAQHALPQHLLQDLLSAFEQDVQYSEGARWYATQDELLHYCARSANPIGRLLLHLYGVRSDHALGMSDAICTALQLINFWQDLSQDIPRGRYYLPLDSLAQHGLTQADILRLQDTPRTIKLIAAHADIAASSMQNGINLPHTVRQQVGGLNGWRAGLELACVVQGGLRVLEKIAAHGHQSLTQRPKLGKWDALVVLWRALRQLAA